LILFLGTTALFRFTNNFQIGYYLRAQADETETLTTAHGFVTETFNYIHIYIYIYIYIHTLLLATFLH